MINLPYCTAYQEIIIIFLLLSLLYLLLISWKCHQFLQYMDQFTSIQRIIQAKKKKGGGGTSILMLSSGNKCQPFIDWLATTMQEVAKDSNIKKRQ